MGGGEEEGGGAKSAPACASSGVFAIGGKVRQRGGPGSTPAASRTSSGCGVNLRPSRVVHCCWAGGGGGFLLTFHLDLCGLLAARMVTRFDFPFPLPRRCLVLFFRRRDLRLVLRLLRPLRLLVRLLDIYIISEKII